MLLLSLIFVGVLLISFTVVALLTRQTQSEKAVRVRVENIQQVRVTNRTIQEDAETILKPEVTGPFTWLDRGLNRLASYENYNKLAIHAASTWTVGAFLAYSIAAGIALFVLAFFFFPAFVLDAILGTVGAYGPYLYLKYRRSRRLKSFNASLPDAIDLMARALRAGHSLSSAIEVLSEQAGETVAAEFGAVFRQQNFGLPIRDALLQMAERVPSKDLRFMVTAMLVQKETGGNLTEILDRTTYVIRERLRIEGEVRTRTAQGRLTGWILSLLPVIMLFLLNIVDPDYSHILLHDPTGQKLLYLGAALIAIGSFFINKIVNIQV